MASAEPHLRQFVAPSQSGRKRKIVMPKYSAAQKR